MIKQIFPTEIYEGSNILSMDHMQQIYDFILVNGEDSQIITPEKIKSLSILKEKILEKIIILNESYGFKKITVSNNFTTHFFPAGKECQMETHSDDLGDSGRKFIALYYVESENNSGGELEIFDPRWLNSCWKDMGTSIKFTPEKNKLIIFPTFLWHRVVPYKSKFFPRMLLDVVIKVE